MLHTINVNLLYFVFYFPFWGYSFYAPPPLWLMRIHRQKSSISLALVSLACYGVVQDTRGGGGCFPALSKMCSPFTYGINWYCKVYHRRVPFHFSCSIFFFLHFSCFYVLGPLQIVLVTLSCRIGRKEIRKFEGGRVWGISVEDHCFSLC